MGKAPDTRAFAKDYANFYGAESLTKEGYEKARSVKYSNSDKKSQDSQAKISQAMS
jgi:hypothetical protein